MNTNTRSGFAQKKWLVASLLLAGLVIFTAMFTAKPAKADAALEADSLTTVLDQFRVLHAIVDQAEQAADTGQRVNFNYAALRADLKTIELGIEQYQAGMRDAPKRIEALGGEYRR